MADAGTSRVEIRLATRPSTYPPPDRIQTLRNSEKMPPKTQHSLARLPTTAAPPNSHHEVFFPTHLMDRPPFPVSAPTPRVYLEKAEMPATLVRLRLYIDEKGRVVNVTISTENEISKTASQQIREMFFATSFVPGHINNTDLPCFMDIEVDLASYVE